MPIGFHPLDLIIILVIALLIVVLIVIGILKLKTVRPKETSQEARRRLEEYPHDYR
jgi:hypothetical protein